MSLFRFNYFLSFFLSFSFSARVSLPLSPLHFDLHQRPRRCESYLIHFELFFTKVTATVPITMEFENIKTDKATLKREILGQNPASFPSSPTLAFAAQVPSNVIVSRDAIFCCMCFVLTNRFPCGDYRRSHDTEVARAQGENMEYCSSVKHSDGDMASISNPFLLCLL